MTERSLNIGIVGCGTAGPAAALFLARQGHRVSLYERVPVPGPVGAGFLLQPTGVHVLRELGLADGVLARASRVTRMHGTTARGRVVLDLSYEALGPGLCGYGVHRGSLFTALMKALGPANVALHNVDMVRVLRREAQRILVDARGEEHGPFDLVLLADGARSTLRKSLRQPPERDLRYPWGALWFMGADPNDVAGSALRQGLDGTRIMAGLLPTGRRAEDGPETPPRVSLFWSIRADRVDAWRHAGLEPWKREFLRVLPQAAPVLAQINSPNQLTFAAYQDVVLSRWDDDRVLVLGDAAHAMSPQLGQGVNLALMDAWTLAEQLRALPLDDALLAYSEERREHLGYYQWATRFLTPFFQSDHAALGWLRDVFMGPLCRVPLVRRQMLLSMAGVHRGFLRSALPFIETKSVARTPG